MAQSIAMGGAVGITALVSIVGGVVTGVVGGAFAAVAALLGLL